MYKQKDDLGDEDVQETSFHMKSQEIAGSLASLGLSRSVVSPKH